jgi:hypothetical protein
MISFTWISSTGRIGHKAQIVIKKQRKDVYLLLICDNVEYIGLNLLILEGD